MSTQTFSRVEANLASASLPSSLARCARPRVQAKIEAIELVEVSLALLMFAIVAGDGAVRRFGFDRLAVRRHQHAGHEAKRTEPLRDRVRLHVAVVVLAGPHVTADHLSAAATMSSIRRCS